MTTSITLNIAQVSNRGNKFAIVAGKAILAKFKTADKARAALDKNRSLYQYWAESVSVSVDNSRKITIIE